MSKPKHTPGPWVICHDEECNRICIDDEAGTRTNPIAEFALTDTTKEVNANARLIAAAPEMYSAIQRVLQLLESHPDFQSERGHTNINHAHAVLSYVLAKASGGAE